MTEALCQAETMIVLNWVEYVLTVNTSQTSSKTGWDYNIYRQWESIKSAVPEIRNFRKTDSKQYIAQRILRNLDDFSEQIFVCANTGEIEWKTYFSNDMAKAAVLDLLSEENRHFVGAELLLKDEIVFEKVEIKQEVENNLKEYLESMQV